MKVVQHTPNTLILRWVSHLPWFNAVGLVIVGLLILSFGGNLTTLSCKRTSSGEGAESLSHDALSEKGQCTLTRRRILSTNTTIVPIDDFQGAEVQTIQQGTPNVRHRVLMVTSSQSIPFTPFRSDYMGQQRHVEELEVFIANGEETSLKLWDYGHSWVYMLGGVAIATGLISAALGIERTTLTLDNKASCLQIHHQRLLNSWTDEYNLDTITNVEIGTPPTTIPQFNTQVQKIKKASLPCLNILFESGNRLPLSLDPNAEPIKEVVRDIREFLQISRNSA